MQRTFAANPFSGLRRNPNLRVITAFIEGIAPAGQPIPLQVTSNGNELAMRNVVRAQTD
jgi:hypothetical protein